MKLNSLNRKNQAVSKHAPTTAIIFISAILLKNLALTMTGWLGKNSFLKTLWNPAFVTSITGIFLAATCLELSVTNVHNLSRLIDGLNWVFILR